MIEFPILLIGNLLDKISWYHLMLKTIKGEAYDTDELLVKLLNSYIDTTYDLVPLDAIY